MNENRPKGLIRETCDKCTAKVTAFLHGDNTDNFIAVSTTVKLMKCDW